MIPLTTPDDRHAFWGWLGALVLLCLLSFGMSELLTGCAAVDLLVACAKRSAGCQ